MTRKLIPISAGFMAGLFTAFMLCVNGPLSVRGCVWLIACAAFIGLSAIVFRVRFRARVIVFCSAFVVAASYSAVYTAIRLAPLEALDGETVSIVGKVIGYTDGDRSAVTVDGRVNGIRTKALVYISGFSGDFGDELTITAWVSKIDDTPFFRSREYYLPDGIYVTASAVGDVKVISSKRTVFDILRGYSRDVSLSIRSNVGGEAGELLAAMVTGDRTAFSDGLRFKLNRAGVGHIASVSGLHVSIVAIAVMALLRKLRAPRVVCASLTELCVFAFIVFSGLRVSAVRAGIMMTVVIAATLFKRRTDPLNTICLCGLLMTIGNPYSAADSSLVLSLAGVFGVAVMSSNVDKEFGLQGWIAQSLSASFCACAATAPFIMLWFNELSLISPLTNLFAIPLCSLALLLGMIYALTGCSLTVVIRIAGFITGVVVKACGFISQLRFTYIPIGSKAVVLSAWFSAVIVLTVYLSTKKVRTAAFSAVLCAAMVLCIHGAQSISARNSIYMTVMCRGEDHALLLRKGAECIIIDFDGGLSGGVQTSIERSGAAKVRAVILFDNAEAAYSAYADLPTTPEIIYLPENAYIFGGSIPHENLPDGSSIEIFGAEMLFRNGGMGISLPNPGLDEQNSIHLLKGLTVINRNGEIDVYKGEIMMEICLEGREWRLS